MTQTAVAQQNTAACTGVVVDESGEPLTGATVHVDGTNIATAADVDGNFRLNGVKPGSTLLVTFVGMTPVQVTWKGEPLRIVMTSDDNVLDEVVVMGYGFTQKRSKVTNSIAKVSEDVLTIGTNANPAQALAGAVSGVKVNVTTGDPGATPNITIRGGTNWDGAASNPLIVVDGQIRDSLADINPNDIESMDILKDAGATALYGARAANGVVLITTKQGKQGNGKVTASIKVGVTNYSSGYDWLNARDYLYWSRIGTYAARDFFPAGYNALFGTGNGNSTGAVDLNPIGTWNLLTLTDDNKYLLDYGWETMPDPLNKYLDTDNTLLFKETDPIKHNLLNNTLSQDYNLSFSGGNDRGNYYASLGYYKADGAMLKTFYERYNFSFTGGYKIANWLQANSVFSYIRANYQNTTNGGQSMGYLFGRVAALPHTVRFENEEGDQLYSIQIGGQSANTRFQPDAFVRNNQTDKFQMSQSLTATIIPGLTLKGTMSWFYNEYHGNSFNKDFQTNPQGSPNTQHATSKSWNRTFNQTYNLVAQFNRTFADKHTINVMLGTEYFIGQYQTFDASGFGAPTEDFGNLQYTENSPENPTRNMSNYYYKEKILSYFGRAEYDYMDKYLIAATFRQDGYSRLQNNRWGFFPGVSAGWVFTKEDFWAGNSSLDWLNYGKLRASFGLNGIVNPNVIGYYTLLGAYSAFEYGNAFGYRISGLPNVNLRWERTRTFDIGLDLGFLNNRINLIATYYNRLTMDKYAQLSLPQTTGFSTVTSNNGSYRNQGVEIEVSATPVRVNDFQWTIGANITYNKNVIVKLPDNDLARNRQGGQEVYNPNWKPGMPEESKFMWVGGYQEGQEPNIMWGWKSAGIIRSEAELAALGDYVDISNSSSATPALYATEAGYNRLVELGRANGAKQLQPGDMVWKDVNGDNMIDQYDMWKIGNRVPHWTGGFNTTFSWKGLQLYARFDMGFDFRVYDATWCWVMSGGQGAFSTISEVKKTWTEDNPNAKLPRYYEGSQLGSNSWLRLSDFNTKPGNYLACRELSLRYTIPQKITQKFRCQDLTISVTGQNLGYLKKTSLPLPDANNSYAALSSDGSGTYNLPKSVIFGLNISF